jgi:hypothetical protein
LAVVNLEAGERRIWTGKRGSLEFIRLRPLIGLLIFKGKVTDDATSAFLEHFPWLVAGDAVHLFFNLEDLQFVGVRLSAAGVSRVASARPRIAAAHALVTNPLLEALADAANLSFGGFMQLHRERPVFEAELERTLRLELE